MSKDAISAMYDNCDYIDVYSRLTADLAINGVPAIKNAVTFIFEGNYDRFHVIKRNTNGNWDDMIDRKQKCMVLWMAEKCEVRPSGCRDVCYKAGDVKNQFILLDGVDYRSQLGTTELLVLEV